MFSQGFIFLTRGEPSHSAPISVSCAEFRTQRRYQLRRPPTLNGFRFFPRRLQDVNPSPHSFKPLMVHSGTGYSLHPTRLHLYFLLLMLPWIRDLLKISELFARLYIKCLHSSIPYTDTPRLTFLSLIASTHTPGIVYRPSVFPWDIGN